MESSKWNIILCIYFTISFSCVCTPQTTLLKERYDVLYDFHGNKILELCNSYLNNSAKFRYGYKHGAFRKEVIPIDGRYEINCSTFSMLIGLGINLEKSSYSGGDNDCISQNTYTLDILQWFSDSIQIKYSRDIARKMHTDGYAFVPNDDLSDLETGDILFFNLDPSNDRPEIDYMGVDHSAIFGYEFGNKYIIYEVGDDKGPQKALRSKESMSKVVLVGRMPYRNSQYSEPTILGYYDIERKNLFVDGKRNYDLAEIYFKTPLQKGHIYTLFVNAYLENDTWLNATYNGTSLYAFNMTNVRDYRPTDNLYQIYFTAPDDITMLSINVRSNMIKEATTVFHSCILYDGYVRRTKK